jgi:RecA/RadA recombinase
MGHGALHGGALHGGALHGSALHGNALAITPVSSGVSHLDEILALGGLPAGRVSEIAGPLSSGKTGLALRLLAEQTRAGKLVAIVDGTGQFYPPAAAAMGIDLRRTLLIAPGAAVDGAAVDGAAVDSAAFHGDANGVRAARAGRARTCADDRVAALARAAEIIARSRSFSMVLIDLPAPTGGKACKMQSKPARRLRVAAQATGTTIVVLSTHSGDVEGAAARIEASPCQTLGAKMRRTQFRISKGGLGHCPSVELSCKSHRFDNSPPLAVAPVLLRALPGEEVSNYQALSYQAPSNERTRATKGLSTP